MFGLIFIDSFFVCVTCFPCCKMSMFFPHVPKVPLSIYITPHKLIINCFKTFSSASLWVWWKRKQSTCSFYVLYTCAQRWYPTHISVQFSLLSHIQLFATPWTAAHQASQSITSSRSLLKFMSIKLVMPSNHLILCHPLLLLPSIFPSIRVFSNESVLHIRWPKYWSFSFNISPSNEHSGLISLLSKGLSKVFCSTTVKSINSSVLSFLYSPTLTSIHDYWKHHSFDKMDIVGKVMSLLFNMLSAAAAASLQLCLTLCDSIDGSPPGSTVPGIL